MSHHPSSSGAVGLRLLRICSSVLVLLLLAAAATVNAGQAEGADDQSGDAVPAAPPTSSSTATSAEQSALSSSISTDRDDDTLMTVPPLAATSSTAGTVSTAAAAAATAGYPGGPAHYYKPYGSHIHHHYNGGGSGGRPGHSYYHGITWTGDWARRCNFKGNDMGQAQGITMEQCKPRCVSTLGCSHFVWRRSHISTSLQGLGTCWLKKGAVTKADAIYHYTSSTAGSSTVCGVVPNWNGNDWAPACYFKGGDMLKQVQLPAASKQQCGPTCAMTTGCTHFTWTSSNGGTCFMKSGTASKLDAFTSSDPTMLCGVVAQLLMSCPPFPPPTVKDPLFGVCYDPMHNPEYPLNGSSLGDLTGAMHADFAHMKAIGVKHARTYYSNFYGIDVAPIAAQYDIKLYLGVYMTTERWYKDQVTSAVNAAVNFPNTVEAILMGNENLWPNGPYSANEIKTEIDNIKANLTANGRGSIPVGTVQRSNEWLNGNIQGLKSLVQSAGIIGVNIYTFFGDLNSTDPPNVGSFVKQWGQMVDLYGRAKVRLTETGFPSDGGFSDTKVPASPMYAKSYYDGVVNWLISNNAASTNGQPMFYFAMYDRRPEDNSGGAADYEKAFGLFKWNRDNKCIM